MTKNVYVVQTGPETFLGGSTTRSALADCAAPFERARIFVSTGAAKQALQRIAWNRGRRSIAPRVSDWHITTCKLQCVDAFLHIGDVIQRESDGMYLQELSPLGMTFCEDPTSALIGWVGSYRVTEGFRVVPVHQNASGDVRYGAWGTATAAPSTQTRDRG